MRIDKWLWVARFYRSRTLARHAIDGGKVNLDGQRVRPGKEITQGIMITLRQGFDEKTVVVKGFLDKRPNAAAAQELYEETTHSIRQREQNALMRKALKDNRPPETKPDKKARRDLLGLKRH